MALAEFSLEDGTTFIVEVDEPEDTGIQRISRHRRDIFQATESLGQALEQMKPVACEIVEKFSSLATPADEVEVKFGLKLTADLGAIFAAVGSEVNYEITLRWQPNNVG